MEAVRPELSHDTAATISPENAQFYLENAPLRVPPHPSNQMSTTVDRHTGPSDAQTSQYSGVSSPNPSNNLGGMPIISMTNSYDGRHSAPRAPEAMIQSRYRASEPPQQLDMVTLVLAFLAFVSVVLLIPLWIAVYQAWLG